MKPEILTFSWTPNGAAITWTADGNSYPYAGARFGATITADNTLLTFVANVVLPAGYTVERYFWDFGDGFTGIGTPINHTYLNASPNANPNTRVTLSAKCSDGKTYRVSQLLNLR